MTPSLRGTRGTARVLRAIRPSERGQRRREAWDPESGSGSVLAVGICGVVAVLLVAALILCSAVIASHRARSAADLAALAAASAPGQECAQARRIAGLHGAELGECVVDGADVEITVTVRPAGAAARWGPAGARARAGPEPGPARGEADRQKEVSGAS